MAEGVRYICGGCGKTIEAWSDGNPYYLDDAGRKQYAYHPDHERLAQCIGSDAPHLCLGCGEELMVDSRSPATRCPRCAATEIADTYRLGGARCPFCKAGAFKVDPLFHPIS
jgi:DNA-directed RNA polymerase subunit RPC12/RpoP